MTVAERRDGWAALAPRGALALTIVLPAVELARIATFESSRKFWIALAVTMLYLPLHVRHVRYAMARRRVPAGAWTLLAMGVLMVLGSVLIGAAWGFMLASMAVSVMLVVRPPWSVALTLMIVAAAFTLGARSGGAIVTLGGRGSYLALSVAFRAVTLLVVVWLVAAIGELEAARATLAAQAVRAHRGRVDAELGRTLTISLEGLATQARIVQRLAETDDPATRAALTALVEASRRRLDETRRIVAAQQGSADRADLTAAGDLLRSGDASSTPRRVEAPMLQAKVPDDVHAALPNVFPAESTPVSDAIATLRRARLLLVAVHVPIVVFVLVAATTGLSSYPSGEPWLAPVVLLLGVLQLRLSFATSRGVRPRFVWLSLGATVLLTGIGLFAIGNQFSTGLWILGATVAMTFNGRRAAIAFVLVVVVAQVIPNLVEFARSGAGAGAFAWFVLYICVLAPLGGGALFAAARVVRTADQLAATRAVLADQAVARERHRFSRDLHDTLGQSLSAISLKGDLAIALLERDPGGALREIRAISAVAERLADDARAVTFDGRSVSFVVEAAGAVDLLRAAGVDAEVDVDLGHLSPQANALFGWAIREGATNVLRHSTATRCVISAIRDDGRFGLEVVNDGAVPPSDNETGNGLAGLTDRAGLLRGVVSTDVHAGRFRLRVLLPEDAA